MALTKAQLKEVLDKVYNNDQSYETYENDGFNGIKLYVNDAEGNENNTIITRQEDENTYIVAILPKKSWVYTDGANEEVYKCRVINDDMVVSNISNIYARGVGAYVKRLTYIKNICVFLGVKLSKNFDKENPAIYQDLSNICDKWFSTGKAPYYFGRYDRSGTPNYSTYVQLGVVKDICLYLNQLGIYRTSADMDICAPQYITYFTSETTNIADYDSFNVLYKTVDKERYYKRLKNYILSIVESVSSITDKDEFAESVINLLDLQFGEDINFSDIVLFYITIGGSAPNPFQITINTFDSTCKVGIYLRDAGYDKYASLYYLYNEDDFSHVTYTLNKSSDGTITHNKTTTLMQKETAHSLTSNTIILNSRILNLNTDKILKLYSGDQFKYNGSSFATYKYYGYPIEYYSTLTKNTVYNIGTQLKLLNEKCLICNTNMRVSSFYYFMKKNNITLGNNDLFIILHVSINSQETHIACIIKDVNTFKYTSDNFNIMQNYLYFLSQIYYQYRYYRSNYGYYGPYPISPLIYTSNGVIDSGYNISNDRITLDSSKECYIYDMKTHQLLGDMTLSASFQYSDIMTYVGATKNNNESFINFGEFIDYVPPTTLEGLSIIEGSTLPNSVIDESSFNAFLNSISAKTSLIRNPYYVLDELQDNVNAATWLQCTVYDTPPATQAEAVDNDIDDMPDSEVEKLDKDIEDNTEDKDDDSDEDSGGGEPDGGDPTEIVDADLVPNGLIGCLKQYKLNTSQNIAFATGLQSLDFSDVVQALIYGNPVNGVVSYATTYDGLWNDENATEQQITLWNNALDDGSNPCMGYRVTKSCKEIDCGTIDFTTNSDIQEMMQDNYTDITDCYLQIMLPFVGLVDLNIRDFYNKTLKLVARVDSLTGAIVYNIFSDNYLVTSVSGNCQSQLPLKSSDMSQLIRNIGNAALAVGGSIAGGFV